MYQPDKIAETLSAAVGADIILRENQVAALDPGVEDGNTGAGVAARPRNAAEVSAVLAACNAARIPVVTHGGRTGLAGAAVTQPGEVILLTDRLEGGIEIDPVERVAIVATSVTQQALQEAAAEHGLSMGIDTASRGSATIGGMIATNAGGMEAFRYGMMRQRLLGIEAVLADGTIVNDLTRVPKANEGYDLKHLFCGAEGTLGVVTRAVLKLEAGEPESGTALLAVPDAAAAIGVMRAVEDTGGLLLCELMWRGYAASVARQTGLDSVLAFAADAPAYLILENTLGEEALFEVLEPFFESGAIIDAVIASSKKQAGEIWRVREDSQAAIRVMGNPLLYDVSVPLSHVDAYMRRLEGEIRGMGDDIEFHALAHLGDGNLHVNVGREIPWSADEKDAVSKAVEAGVKAVGGAVSAEHGIGTHKLATFGRNAPVGNLSVMRAIKAALDPNGIMNPGKVLPA